MKQSIEKLEISVYQLSQKFETLVGENRRLKEENERLKREYAQETERLKNGHAQETERLKQIQAEETANLLQNHAVETARLQSEQEKQKRDHDTAVAELSEALLVQVAKLREDLQGKIDALTAEKELYRNALAQGAGQIRTLISRLPQNVQN